MPSVLAWLTAAPPALTNASQQPDCTPGRGWTCVDICGHVWTSYRLARCTPGQPSCNLYSFTRASLPRKGLRDRLAVHVHRCGHMWTYVDITSEFKVTYRSAGRPSFGRWGTDNSLYLPGGARVIIILLAGWRTGNTI